MCSCRLGFLAYSPHVLWTNSTTEARVSLREGTKFPHIYLAELTDKSEPAQEITRETHQGPTGEDRRGSVRPQIQQRP